MIRNWMNNVQAVAEKKVKQEKRYILANGKEAPHGPKDIIKAMNIQDMRPSLVHPKQLPDDCLTAVS